MSYPSTDQQNIQPSPYPDWYKDRSILALILIVISGIFIFYISILFGLLISLISVIVAVLSKKQQGRIALLSIILTSIVLIVEIIFVGNLLYQMYIWGVI